MELFPIPKKLLTKNGLRTSVTRPKSHLPTTSVKTPSYLILKALVAKAKFAVNLCLEAKGCFLHPCLVNINPPPIKTPSSLLYWASNNGKRTSYLCDILSYLWIFGLSDNLDLILPFTSVFGESYITIFDPLFVAVSVISSLPSPLMILTFILPFASPLISKWSSPSNPYSLISFVSLAKNVLSNILSWMFPFLEILETDTFSSPALVLSIWKSSSLFVPTTSTAFARCS